MIDSLAPTSFRSWCVGVGRVLRRSGLALVVVWLLVLAPTWLLEALFGAVGAYDLAASGPTAWISVGEIVGPVVGGVLALFGSAASVVIVVRDAAERPRPVAEVVAVLGRRALGLLGWGLAVGLVLLLAGAAVALFAFLAAMSWAVGAPGDMGLAGAGLLAAGLILAYLATVVGAPFAGVVVVEGRGVRRMVALAHTRFLAVLGRTVIVVVVIAGALLLAGLLAVLPSGGSVLTFPGEPLWWASQVLAAVVRIPATVVALAAAVVLYGELRAREEPGVGANALADELDARARRGAPVEGTSR